MSTTHTNGLIVTSVYVFIMCSAPLIPAPIAMSLMPPPISADPLPCPIRAPLCFHGFSYFILFCFLRSISFFLLFCLTQVEYDSFCLSLCFIFLCFVLLFSLRSLFFNERPIRMGGGTGRSWGRAIAIRICWMRKASYFAKLRTKKIKLMMITSY